jgi:putative ABC transport system permease protein
MMDILPILATLRRHKTTACLVVLEIALTCAIICNAAFLINLRLQRIGLPTGTVESELVQITMSGIGASADVQARVQEDLAALRLLPGVRAVTAASQVPLGQSGNMSSVSLSRDQKRPTLSASGYYGESLIATLGLELTQGRDFDTGEYHWVKDVVAKAPGSRSRTVILAQALADKLFPGQAPLGKEIFMDDEPLRVVGIVRHLIIPQTWTSGEQDYSMILPVRMSTGAGRPVTFIIRTSPEQRQAVIAAAVAKLKALDPRRIATQKRTLEKVRANFFASDRVTTNLLAGICLALLIVTALGIVGLASFWVAQRRRQIGVRRALGARRVDILRYFQTENFLLATIGIALGMAMAYGISLLLMRHYELPRLPAVYFPIGAVLLWLLGQVAVLAPALRAASVPPVEATRG